VDRLTTDERVQRIREEPARVILDGRVLVVRASDRLPRRELFEHPAELDVLSWQELVAHVARDTAEIRLARAARRFDVCTLGLRSTTFMGGIHATLRQH
jgi:hypothetical protein